MTKSKQSGPALFDLLGPTQEDVNRSLRVPEQAGARSTEPVAAETPPPERAIVPGRPRAPGARPGPSPPTSSRRRRPLMEFDDECVHLSLTSVRAAVAVFVLLVGLLGVYELGRTNGRVSGFGDGHRAGRASFEADATSEVEAARHRPPASHLVEGLLQSDPGSTEAQAPDNSTRENAASWVQGHTYVVAQEFAPHAHADVEQARAFLRSKGIDTTAIALDTDWFQLITTQGFDRSDPVQRDLADRLLAKVHEAGIAYYADGGGYKLEGYFKTLRKQSW